MPVPEQRSPSRRPDHGRVNRVGTHADARMQLEIMDDVKAAAADAGWKPVTQMSRHNARCRVSMLRHRGNAGTIEHLNSSWQLFGA